MNAEAVAGQLVSRDPSDADALQLLGVICLQTARPDDAVDFLRRAIRARPAWAEAWNNLGVALETRDQLEKAENAFKEAVRLKPGYSQAHVNLGNVLRRRGRVVEAATAYSTAAALAPDDGAAESGLGAACLDMGRLSDAIGHYRRAAELQPDSPAAHSDLLFWLLHAPDISPQALFDEHRRWDERFERRGNACVARGWQERATQASPLRVGYVSADFREHTVARFIEPVLEGHDRSAVIAVCYSDAARPDCVTARLRGHAAEWRDTAGLSHDALVAQIRHDRIDILVDLAGHMGENRLCVFARRAAPVQATYMGYPCSTGLQSMDWRLTDEASDPVGTTEMFHTEKLFRLAGCAFAYRPTESPLLGPLPALSGGFVTFGMLNRAAKITPASVALWAKVLDEVPGSRLLVLAPGGEANLPLRELFENAGIEPSRLSLAPTGPRDHYLRLAQEVDIALDTFPYAGMTTTCDFLWMGVPTVTLAGRGALARAGVSLLEAVGLPQFIANTPEEYVRIAAEAAGDLDALVTLRATLRERMSASPLLDGRGLAERLEAAYRTMWRECQWRPSGGPTAGARPFQPCKEGPSPQPSPPSTGERGLRGPATRLFLPLRIPPSYDTSTGRSASTLRRS